VIPTQYGNVPDVAFEEIKQFTAQQQQAGPIPLSTSSWVSNISNPANSSTTISDTISNQTRPGARDLFGNSSNGLTRSRSLAYHSTARPTAAAAASTYINNPTYQTPSFPTNKQAFQTPTRYGVSRFLSNGTSNNNLLPSGSYTSSPNYHSNRSIPIGIPSNIKHRYTTHHHPIHRHHHTPNGVSNSATATPNNDQQRPRYETTYRSSFIKPLAP
jgi:hypothetical protein